MIADFQFSRSRFFVIWYGIEYDEIVADTRMCYTLAIAAETRSLAADKGMAKNVLMRLSLREKEPLALSGFMPDYMV